MADYYGGGGGQGGGGRYGGGGGGGRGGFRGGQGGGGRGRDDSKLPNFYENENAEEFCKIFLGGLHPDTTEDSLKEYFGKYGKITDCIVMRDPTTRRSRNFGFVTFSEFKNVDDVQRDRPHTIDGKTCETKRATPKNSQNENTKEKCLKLFVGGLNDDISEEDLRTEFGKHGEIEKISLVFEKENKSKRKNFCFISFTDHDPVDKISLIRSLYINGHKIDAKKAVDRDKQGGQDQRRGGGGGYGGGGYGAGGGGYGGGGYGGGGYGGGDGGYGGGGYNNGNDYNNFGQDYGGGYGGGPMRGGGYTQRSSGPYGGGGGGGQDGSTSTGGYGGGGYSGGGGGYDSYGSGGYGGGGGGGYGGGGGGSRGYQGR